MSSKQQYINLIVEQENISSLSFLDVRNFRKNGTFTTTVTGNQHSVEFSPIVKVSFQCTKREDFLIHYFIGILAYVVISRNFILELIIWRLLSWKTVIPHTSLIRVLDHFLVSGIHLKLFLRVYLKEMFLLSWRSWEVLRFKFERSFKNQLMIHWGLVIEKSFLRHPLELKAFSHSRVSYLRCYF